MSAVQRFHEAANDALVKLSGCCLPGAKLALVIVTPGEPERDIILEDRGLDRNEVVSALRRRGLSIDGDNTYKRDLCDAVVGPWPWAPRTQTRRQQITGASSSGISAGRNTPAASCC